MPSSYRDRTQLKKILKKGLADAAARSAGRNAVLNDTHCPGEVAPADTPVVGKGHKFPTGKRIEGKLIDRLRMSSYDRPQPKTDQAIRSADSDDDEDQNISSQIRLRDARRIGGSSPTYQRREPELDRWTETHQDWTKAWYNSLVFPPTGKNRTTVDKDDISRLDEGEFLNDNLVNFYLRYLQVQIEKERPEILKKVYILNTFFFEVLRSSKGKVNYEGVKGWTAKVDLFAYDYIVVPVNEHYHWYLAIVCNASNALYGVSEVLEGHAVDLVNNTSSKVLHENHSIAHVSLDDRTGEEKRMGMDDEKLLSSPLAQQSLRRGKDNKLDLRQPKIITLDSLDARHSPTCRYLKEYLAEEARNRKQRDLTVAPSGMTAKGIPQQTNYCDCGVFVLGYMEEILKDPDTAIRKLLLREDLEWDVQPTKLRKKVRSLLFDLQKDQQSRLEAEKSRRRKARNKVTDNVDGPSSSSAAKVSATSSPVKTETMNLIDDVQFSPPPSRPLPDRDEGHLALETASTDVEKTMKPQELESNGIETPTSVKPPPTGSSSSVDTPYYSAHSSPV